jgi:hypothetical protein
MESHCSGEGADSTKLGPGTSCEEGFQTKYKDHHSASTPTCAQSSCLMSLGVSEEGWGQRGGGSADHV